MTIIVGIDPGGSDIRDFPRLQTSVRNWLNRSDLTDLIPDFIGLAEERMNRALRVRAMEVALTPTATDENYITVPTGIVGVKSLWMSGYQTSPLKPQSYDFVQARGTTGVPSYYAWQGDCLYFDGTGTVNGILYERIPALSNANVTNWLLDAAPSVYLFGALKEGFDYVRNDSERDRWDARFLQAIADLQASDQRDRYLGPLQVSLG